MCYYTTRTDRTRKTPLKATKDITVWKVFENRTQAGVYPPYYPMLYEFGEEYFEDALDTPKTVRDKSELNVGLHSYSSLRHAERSGFMYIVIKCVIPKGSKYFYNRRLGEYISDTLRIGKLEDIVG